jgi:hypothetical protein
LKLSLFFLESDLLGRFDNVAFPQAKVLVEQFEGRCSQGGVVV